MTPEQLSQIADELDSGFKCYIHKKDHSVIFIPDEDKYPDMEIDGWENDIKQIEANPADYLEIEPMDSRESFKVMEQFVETVTDAAIQNRLAESLQRPKPFQNFKFDVDRSGQYRQKWFEFKKENIVDWVKRQVEAAEM